MAVPVDACNAPYANGTNLAWVNFGNGMPAFDGCAMQTWSGANGSFSRSHASRLAFFAPGGTTIDAIEWGGSWGKSADCGWSAELRAANLATGSSTRLLGLGSGEGCSASGGNGDGTAWAVAPAGTTALYQQVECGQSSCAGGGWSWFHTRFARVILLDHHAPVVYLGDGGLSSSRWVRRHQGLAYYAEDNLGVQKVEISVDGTYQNHTSHPCDWRRPVGCANHPGSLFVETGDFSDGPHQVRVRAVDAGGLDAYADVTAKFDNHAPDRVAVALKGGEGWRRKNGFDITWANRPENFAPIAAAGYKLCRAGTTECETGKRDAASTASLANLAVPGSGDYTLEVWRIDAAGNGAAEDARPSPPVQLRLDAESPQLAFEPQDAGDPLKVAVAVRDEVSGVEAGSIELRRRGGNAWHELDAHVENGHLVGYVDDQRFNEGAYELRAFARDYAGNTGSTDRQANGASATLQLPVRVPTALHVGARKVAVIRKVQHRGGRRRVVKRRVTRLVPRVWVRIGGHVTLHGRLVNPDGQPVDSASIEILGKPAFGESEFASLGLVRTGADGTFTYRARGSQSRVIRFHYPGARQIRAATRDVFVRVPASSSISVSDRRVLNGDTVRFKGRLRGGAIPDGGKLIEMQAFFRKQWRTFSTVRSDEEGGWRFNYQFGGTSGRIVYRFRVLVPHEGGYPFDTGRSPVVRVSVRGP